MIEKKMIEKIDELCNILATEGAIDEEKFLQGVEDLIFQSAPMILGDKSIKNWKLVKNTRQKKLFLPSELEIVTLFEESGSELMSQAKTMKADFGHMQLQYLLKHRKEMPKEWDEYVFIFPGTVLCDDRYFLRIPYIYPVICGNGPQNSYYPSGYLFYDRLFRGSRYKLLRAIE